MLLVDGYFVLVVLVCCLRFGLGFGVGGLFIAFRVLGFMLFCVRLLRGACLWFGVGIAVVCFVFDVRLCCLVVCGCDCVLLIWVCLCLVSVFECVIGYGGGADAAVGGFCWLAVTSSGCWCWLCCLLFALILFGFVWFSLTMVCVCCWYVLRCLRGI